MTWGLQIVKFVFSVKKQLQGMASAMIRIKSTFNTFWCIIEPKYCVYGSFYKSFVDVWYLKIVPLIWNIPMRFVCPEYTR